jgi:hypothetical protein
MISPEKDSDVQVQFSGQAKRLDSNVQVRTRVGQITQWGQITRESKCLI